MTFRSTTPDAGSRRIAIGKGNLRCAIMPFDDRSMGSGTASGQSFKEI